jgi:protein-tyrosine phosphatase
MERYHCVAERLDYARQLYEMGIYLQVNANSIVNKHNPMWKTFVIPALEEHLVHFVSSDAHDTKGRAPELSKAAAIVTKTCDAKYANKIFCQNALDMLAGEMI